MATFDILGYREFTKANPMTVLLREARQMRAIHENARRDQAAFVEVRRTAIATTETDPDPDLDPFDSPPVVGDEFVVDDIEPVVLQIEYCKTLQYADTILLYANDDSPASLANVIIASTRLLAQAGIHGIPLRGGVTVGDLLVEPKEALAIGAGLVRAHDLEQAQDWVGGILDPELDELARYDHAVRTLRMDEWLVRYPVPLKQGRREVLALAWPRSPVEASRSLYAIEARMPAKDAAATQKQHEAKLFVEFMLHDSRHAPPVLERYDDPRLRAPVWDRWPDRAQA